MPSRRAPPFDVPILCTYISSAVLTLQLLTKIEEVEVEAEAEAQTQIEAKVKSRRRRREGGRVITLFVACFASKLFM